MYCCNLGKLWVTFVICFRFSWQFFSVNWHLDKIKIHEEVGSRYVNILWLYVRKSCDQKGKIFTLKSCFCYQCWWKYDWALHVSLCIQLNQIITLLSCCRMLLTFSFFSPILYHRDFLMLGVSFSCSEGFLHGICEHNRTHLLVAPLA